MEPIEFSFDYFQPKEYRFSLDSVMLAKSVASFLKDNCSESLDNKFFLDLCSGCGVIGLELKFHLPAITYMDFIEIQEIYHDYFKKNLQQVTERFPSENLKFHFINENYLKLKSASEFHNKYHFIVANPPYFEKGEGLLSPSEFKNRCRFFLDASSDDFIESLLSALLPNGMAFFLSRHGKDHGRDRLSEIKQIVKNRGTIKLFNEIRGTQCFLLVKNSL